MHKGYIRKDSNNMFSVQYEDSIQKQFNPWEISSPFWRKYNEELYVDPSCAPLSRNTVNVTEEHRNSVVRGETVKSFLADYVREKGGH